MANFQHFDIRDGEDNPKRFASLEASDLDELLEAAHSKRTKTALISLSLFTKVSSLEL